MVESVIIIRDTKKQLQNTHDCADVHLDKIPVSIKRFFLIKWVSVKAYLNILLSYILDNFKCAAYENRVIII